MIYYTIKQKAREHQLNIEDIWMTPCDISNWYTPNIITGTVTRAVEVLPDHILRSVDVDHLISILTQFNVVYGGFANGDMHKHYDTFKIPKKSGGLRTINAPHDDLKKALYDLKAILEQEFHVMYHTSAYAYVEHRSTIDAIKRHQLNESNWFAKTDFTNFFGSTTMEFLLHMATMIFPFNLVMENEVGREELRKALSLCMLDGGLPQGTPISPLLTNWMMIPIDHRLYNAFHEHGYIYTRYADDIQLSHKCTFNINEKVAFINQVLKEFEAPFVIKDEKTRYGSRAGSNWNLGLMLNKDNQITIGYKNAQRFNAMCHNYIRDHLNGVRWEPEDIYHFRGLISYYIMVEPDYINSTIRHYNDKFNVNMKQMLEEDMHRG